MFNSIFKAFQKSKDLKPRRRSSSAVNSTPCEVLEDRLLLTLSNFETHVNTNTANNQFESVTASNNSGESVVVWTTKFNSSATDTDIRAQRFDSSGRKVGAEIFVHTSSRPESSPSVAIDQFGDFVVVWVDQYNSSDKDIRAQRFYASGALRGSVIEVAQTNKNEFEPSVAIANNGDFVVSYTLQYSTNNFDVQAVRLSDSGKIQSSFAVSNSTSLNERSSKVTRTPDGRFAIAYTAAAIGSTNRDVKLVRFSPQGGAFAPPLNIASGSNDQSEPSVSTDDNLNIVVSWREIVGNLEQIKASIVTNGGYIKPSLTIASISSTGIAGGFELSPSVAFQRSGKTFVVVYTEGFGAGQQVRRPLVLALAHHQLA